MVSYRVGCGLTAKAACSGAADIIAVYNTAVYRVRGLPTSLAFLPYDDTNENLMDDDFGEGYYDLYKKIDF